MEKIKEILRTAKIIPAIDQYEAHPYLQQRQLVGFLKDEGIVPVAYSPRGNDFYDPPRVVYDPTVVDVAKKLGKDPFVLLLSWAVQRGTGALAKSVNPEHIEKNFQDFIIPEPEFEALNRLERHHRYNLPIWWGMDVFGELGWEEARRRAEAAVSHMK